MSKPLIVSAERSNLLLTIKQQLRQMRQSIPAEINDTADGIRALNNLAESLEERLVGFRYTSMVLLAVEYLSDKYKDKYPNIQWSWHPLSDESEDEPDLTGVVDGKMVIAAEIDPSKFPIAQVSILMTARLSLLVERDEAELYYFVRSLRMEFHARNKINKTKKSVTVVNTASFERQS